MREREIFAAARERPDPGARSAYLDTACDGESVLRERVEVLLRAHDRPDSLLDAPALAAAGPGPGTDPHVARAGRRLRRRPRRRPDPRGVRRRRGAEETAATLAFLAAPARRPDSLGRLGHYEVLEVLGRGGFGVVFRAFDDVLQRVVAVKMLLPSMASTSPARRRFLREARSAAPIQHENVVRIHNTGEEPLPYLVMEFVRGETLQQRLERTGPLEVAEVLRTGRQLAAGLAAAHAQGLIHRDIKPANILIEAAPLECVKITDFGLARAADDASLTRSGVVAGTPMYMAPEQAKSDALDHRADLFSLGSVLYEMLTGRPPFRAETVLGVLKRVADDSPRPIRDVIPEVPEWLCRIVQKLHEKNPADRFQSAKEVADLLADCEAQLKLHGALRDFSRIPGGNPRHRGRWKWAAVAALVALIPLGGIGAYALTRPDPQSAGTTGPREPDESTEPVPGPVTWGEVIDPLGKCRLSEANGRLTVHVPEGLYDLNPLPNFNMNAPRVMREVEGDFDARVTVHPFPHPKMEMGLRREAAYTGAGLVVWQDGTRLLRFFRAGMGHNRAGAPYAHAEWFTPVIHDQKLAYVPDIPLHLRIRREGGELHLTYSTDGRTWLAPVGPITDIPLGARVRVGVTAVNALKRDFTVRMEGFEIKGPPGPPSDKSRASAPPAPAVKGFTAAHAGVEGVGGAPRPAPLPATLPRPATRYARTGRTRAARRRTSRAWHPLVVLLVFAGLAVGPLFCLNCRNMRPACPAAPVFGVQPRPPEAQRLACRWEAKMRMARRVIAERIPLLMATELFREVIGEDGMGAIVAPGDTSRERLCRHVIACVQAAEMELDYAGCTPAARGRPYCSRRNWAPSSRPARSGWNRRASEISPQRAFGYGAPGRDGRKEDPDRRPGARLADQVHPTAAPPDRAADDRQPQPGPLPRRLRSEERLKRPRLHLVRHPRARVAHGQQYVLARRGVGVRPPVPLPHPEHARLDGQRPAAGHRVLRVDRQVQNHLLHLCRIGPHPGRGAGQVGDEGDVLPEEVAEEPGRPRHRLVEVENFWLGSGLAAEGQKLRRQPRGPLARGRHLVYEVAVRTRVREFVEKDLGVPVDDRQQVVEVVRDATGQKPRRLRLLRVPELLLHLFPFGQVDHNGRNAGRVGGPVLGDGADPGPERGAVLPPVPALRLVGTRRSGRDLAVLGQDAVAVLGEQQIGHGHPGQLDRGVPGHLAEGAVGAEDAGVGCGLDHPRRGRIEQSPEPCRVAPHLVLGQFSSGHVVHRGEVHLLHGGSGQCESARVSGAGRGTQQVGQGVGQRRAPLRPVARGRGPETPVEPGNERGRAAVGPNGAPHHREEEGRGFLGRDMATAQNPRGHTPDFGTPRSGGGRPTSNRSVP